MHIVIVGGVALGATAASKLIRDNPNNKITIFEKSSYVSYSNCGLPYGISEIFPSNSLAPLKGSKIEKMGINVNVNHEVIQINESNKTIKVKDLKTSKTKVVNYDKLILAMGAKSIKLPIEGLDKEKDVYVLKTYDDLNLIKQNVEGKKRALVIGAGFTGIEIAENIAKLGLEVNVVEGSLRTSGFDFDMSSFVDEYLNKNKVKVISGLFVTKIDPKNKKAHLSNEMTIDYDIIFATGITPNIDLVKNTSIKLEQDKFIKVNSRMQTFNKDIYAGGDLVLTKNLIDNKKVYNAMARNANYHARLIANHISNLKVPKPMKTSLASVIKIFNKTAGSAGLTETYLKNTNIAYEVEMATLNNSSKNSSEYDKLIIKLIYASKNGKLLGIQSFGKGAEKIVDVFAIALRNKMKVKDLENLHLSYQPWYSTTQHPFNILGQIILKKDVVGYKTICPYAIPKDSFIIDIRSKALYEKGHIWNAVNIPVKNFNREMLPKNLETPSIYVHCNSGFGASIAAIKLIELGYQNVYNIYGGNNLFQAMYKKQKKQN